MTEMQETVDRLLPDLTVSGVGAVVAPTLSSDDVSAMRRRADGVEDQQIKTDLFRLLAAVETYRRGRG